MKVLLVNPDSKFIRSRRLYRQFLPPVAPLGLAYIAAVLEGDGVDVDIIDMFSNRMGDKEVLGIIKDTRPEIIGLSVLTSVLNDVKDLVERIRMVNKDIKIVLGNTHASCFPGQLLRDGLADIIVRGEGELSMLSLCRALRDGEDLTEVKGISYVLDGEVFHNPEEEGIENLDELPFPAFHLLDLDRYREFPILSIYKTRFLPISASRGCPYQCYFCSQDRINKRPRYRDLKRVVDEMECMHRRFNIEYFCFTDAYFPFSESAGLEFCDEIIKRGLHNKIRWITESRVDKISRRLLKEMKKAGARLILYGIETGNQEVLDRSNKRVTLQQARQALSYTKEEGILSLGLYMLGLPGETRESCKETVEFAKELDTDIAKFNIAIPFPGSQFFKDCLGDEEIESPERYTSWHDSFNLNLKELRPSSSGLTYRELVDLQRKAMISYYLRPKVVLRFFYKRIVNFKNLFYGACWLLLMFFLNFLERIIFIFHKEKDGARTSE